MRFVPSPRPDGSVNEQKFYTLYKFMAEHRVVCIFCRYIIFDLFMGATVRLCRMAVAIREVLVQHRYFPDGVVFCRGSVS